MLLKFKLFSFINFCLIFSPSICQSQIQGRNRLETVVQRVNTSEEVLKTLKSISVGSEQFALDLFGRIALELQHKTDNTGDFMISPFSIWSLLILMVEGASGDTLGELQQTLRINQDPKFIREAYQRINTALMVNTTTLEVSSLQAMFSDKNRPVDREYEDVIERLYKANLVPIDFQNSLESSDIINNFVNRATRGLIKDVVFPNDLAAAQMVLISAIFFRGQWTQPFNKSLTKSEMFYGEDEKPIGIVNMMYQKGSFALAAINSLDSFVIELPYGVENRLSMIVILPKKGFKLVDVIEKLSKVGTAGIFDGLNKVRKDAEYYGEDMEVELFMPRFSTTTDFVLNGVLEQMGIKQLFNSQTANLSKISSHPIYLSRLFHKSQIEVTEEGTVASAVTGGVFTNKISPPKFMVNRPFAYLIVEKTTNSLLFVGQIKYPSTS